VLAIQPRESGAGSTGITPDELVDQLAAKILDEIPPTLRKSEALKGTFKKDADGLMESLSTFLG
jgi:hypothetical protein